MYHVFVEIDAGQRVHEGPWEDNNVVLAGTVDVTYAPPDLEVTAADVLVDGVPVTEVPSGTPVTIEWESHEHGHGPDRRGLLDRPHLPFS